MAKSKHGGVGFAEINAWEDWVFSISAVLTWMLGCTDGLDMGVAEQACTAPTATQLHVHVEYRNERVETTTEVIVASQIRKSID